MHARLNKISAQLRGNIAHDACQTQNDPHEAYQTACYCWESPETRHWWFPCIWDLEAAWRSPSHFEFQRLSYWRL